MRNLQVEELEPRELLNGADFSPRLAPAQPSVAGTSAYRAAQHLPSVDFGHSCAGSVNPGGRGGGGTEVGPSPGFAPHGLDGWGPAAGRGDAVPARPDPDAGGSPEAVPTGGGRGANPAPPEAAPSVPSELPNSLLLLGLEAVVAAPDLRAAASGLSAVGSPGGGQGLVSPQGPSPVAPFPTPRSDAPPEAVEPGGPSGRGTAPPPQEAGALSALPPFDLSALELGVQQFIERLERTGRPPAGGPDGAGPYLWLAAAAAAAAACELARRQLGRPARRPAPDFAPAPASSPDPFSEG
jgi:hypothetical protein